MLKTSSIHKISIRDLCNLADVNRTTFYNYYKSQYDLLQDIEEDYLDQVNMYIKSHTEKKEKSLNLLLNFCLENLELSKLLFVSNIDSNFPKRLLNLESIKEKLSSKITDNCDKAEVYYNEQFIIYGGYHIIVEWIENENRISANEFAKILENIVKNMLRGGKYEEN